MLKKPMMTLCCISLISVFSSPLWADQCQSVSKEQAAQALDFLKPSGQYIEFCEPCGDKDFYKREPQIINNLQAKADGEYWDIYLNGKNVDLAYIFVSTKNGDYLNLSKLANCPSSDVTLGFSNAANSN